MDFPGGSVVKNPPAKKGAAADTGSVPGSGRSPGEGNGNPLQYSCLENPLDRGAWWATVHGVAKSQTWLSNWAYTHSQDIHMSSVNVFSSCCHISILLSTKQLQVFTGNTEALSLSEPTFVSRFSSDSPKPGQPRCAVTLACRAMHRQTCGQGLMTVQVFTPQIPSPPYPLGPADLTKAPFRHVIP